MRGAAARGDGARAMTNDIHRIMPLAVRLTPKFWAERGSILVRTNGCTVRFCPHPRQVGFANAGDARPSHWKPLVSGRSEEHTSELQSLRHLVCRLLLEKKKKNIINRFKYYKEKKYIKRHNNN